MKEASVKCVDKYVASVQERLSTALREAQAQSMVEHTDKNGTMTER